MGCSGGGVGSNGCLAGLFHGCLCLFILCLGVDCSICTSVGSVSFCFVGFTGWVLGGVCICCSALSCVALLHMTVSLCCASFRQTSLHANLGASL